MVYYLIYFFGKIWKLISIREGPRMFRRKLYCCWCLFLGLFFTCYAALASPEIGSISGRLEIRAADTADVTEKSEVMQYLLISGDQIYYLHFKDGVPKNLETDDILRINRSTLLSTIDHQNREILVAKKDIKIEKVKHALPLAFGPQSTITFLVNFVDKPNDRPWTPAQINTLVYTTINNHFLESSYQQTNLTGQVAGWYVVNVNSGTTCTTMTSQMSTLADQAATNAGIDLSKFKRKVYIFPKTSTCSWAGLGTVGGTNTKAWINGAVSDMRTTAHELGHNFGIYHSQLLTCSGSPNTGNCSRQTYGDGTDIMGAARTSHFNAYQKDRLGWLGYQTSPPITTVTASGDYTIDAYETKNQNPKALKILKRDGGTDYYYLEFRQGIGFDAELANCGTCNYTKGVVFHQGNATNGDTSDLLDMSPSNQSNGVVALLPGQSWTDPSAPNGGVTFKVISVASTGAVVNVSFGSTPPPPPTEPELKNGVPVANLSGAQGSESFYYMDVPAGKPTLTVKISGGTGDADLYVRFGSKPTATQYDCRPYLHGNNETCTINNPQAGKYYIMLGGYLPYSGVTLAGNY